MISRIVFDKKTINMNIPGNPKIFDVDSISLLIGVNGSGKTKYFHHIINALHIQKNKRNDCKLYNEYGLEFNESEIKKWGVIYFSPLSFNHLINEQNDSLIDIIPNTIEPYENNGFKDILDSFNIKTKLTAKIELKYSKVLDEFIDALVIANSKKSINNSLNTGMSKDIIYSNIDNLAALKIKKINNSYHENTITLRNEEKIRNELADEIFHRLVAKNSLDKIFSIFCVAEFYMKNYSLSPGILFFLFLKMGFFSNYPMFMDMSQSMINTNEVEEHIIEYSNLIKLLNNKEDTECRFDNELNKINSIEANYSAEVKKIITSMKRYSDLFSIKYSGMSSGQFTLLTQINSMNFAVKQLKNRGLNKILVLIDEGDVFLHLDWQVKYIHTINLFFSRIKEKLNISTLQIILSTHSPILTTDIPKEFICNLDESKDEEKINSSFAAPLYQLLNDSFSTQTIGKFASEKINGIIKNVKNNKLNDSDNYLIEQIDNDLIKNEIKSLISKYNNHGKNNI